MLLLAPIILIILGIFAANMYYNNNHTVEDMSSDKKIIKEVNQTDVRKDYLNKYLKK